MGSKRTSTDTMEYRISPIKVLMNVGFANGPFFAISLA